MKAKAILKNLNGNDDKDIIIRNLSRIMNLRVTNVNIKKKTIYFLYSTSIVFEQARRELWRIGYPVESCKLSGFEPNSRQKYVVVNMA
ncbi:hypothetical protein KCTC52924_03631 [Arenibacter antarcticus]|uniref:Copper chaperone CopZ n=1 Tax=Arenibacter antarcticus TaxID=2040469 RepID=A0ABW5VDX5_9FLAO|nr:hypothetical protein [Arenibacter sp. H213]MCM4168079.1 hypothetical protein [Arenibacter sp. H213]